MKGIQVKSKTDGLITYMRTDSVTISQEAIKNITSHIKSHYGSNYLPKILYFINLNLKMHKKLMKQLDQLILAITQLILKIF